MFKSSNFVSDVSTIPSNWIFEYYLKTEPLRGQRIRIKSIFNEKDSNPSMYIYFSKKTNSYRFKCFSTGKEGTGYDLVHHLLNIPLSEVFPTIRRDYEQFLLSGGDTTEITIEDNSWQVADYTVRQFNMNDAVYWQEYNISDKMLAIYNVKPLASYKMSNGVESFIIANEFIYGYFQNNGTLYKIYQPKNLKQKFIKQFNFVQGSEQLFRRDNLVIVSSLKDGMALRSLGLRLDFVAPNSENTMFSDMFISDMKSRYKQIAVILDSDTIGTMYMNKYHDLYQLPFVFIPEEKDIADVVKNRGVSAAKYIILPKLHHAFEKYDTVFYENYLQNLKF
jgi:hypothetical protein